MIVAAAVLHLRNGFFVHQGGWEYNLVLAASALGVAFAGPGAFSLDAVLGLSWSEPWGAVALIVGFMAAAVVLLARSLRSEGQEIQHTDQRLTSSSKSLLPTGGVSRFARSILGDHSDRDGEIERAAAAEGGLRPDPSAVRLDDALGDGEPQPRTAAVGLPGLVDALEQVREALGVDARAGIRHPKEDNLLLRGRAECDPASG